MKLEIVSMENDRSRHVVLDDEQHKLVRAVVTLSNGQQFLIGEDDGALRIYTNRGRIILRPVTANAINVTMEAIT